MYMRMQNCLKTARSRTVRRVVGEDRATPSRCRTRWPSSCSVTPGVPAGPIDMAHLEFLLQSVEILQGRRFVDGSIKHYELVKEG